MKYRIKNTLLTILFITLLFLMVWIVQGVFTPKWYSPNPDSETDKYGYFYTIPDNSLDYIVLGTSPAYQGIYPSVIYAETGISGYDFGTGRQSANLSYYWLVEALKTQSPKYVFFDVSPLFNDYNTLDEDVIRSLIQMKFSANKIEAILNCKNETQDIFEIVFPLYRFHDRWTQLLEIDFEKRDFSEYFMCGEYIRFAILLNTVKDTFSTEYEIYSLDSDDSTYTVQDVPVSVRETPKIYFEKMLELCDERGIEFVPFLGPSMGWRKERSQAVRNFLNSYGLELLDLANSSDIVIYDWSKDTGDGGYHANYWGGVKASNCLGEYLKKKGLPDHRGEKKYSEWDKRTKEFLNWEEKNLLTNEEVVNTYLTALEKVKEDSLIIITVKDDASGAWNPMLESAMYRLGITNSFYDQIQNSFVGILDSGKSIYEKWSDKRITVNTQLFLKNGEALEISVTGAGFVCGNLSSVIINGTEYSLNNRGINIVAVDKNTGNIWTSISIDTHSPEMETSKMELSGVQTEQWDELLENVRTVYDGIYNIIPAGNDLCALDISGGSAENGANLALWKRNSLAPQEFEIVYVGDGLYTIRAVCSNKYLSIENMGSTAGSNVVQQDYNGLAVQKWSIIQNTNGTFSFKSLYNGYFLDVQGGEAVPGTNIQVWEKNYLDPQQFYLEKIE